MLTLILGMLGLGGFAAASFIAPSVVFPAVISIAGALMRCRPCLVALALVATYVAADIHVTKRERASCAAADLAMQLQKVQRDAKAQADAAQFATSQVRELSDQVADLNQKVAHAKNAPHVACPLGARADKLRAIAPR